MKVLNILTRIAFLIAIATLILTWHNWPTQLEAESQARAAERLQVERRMDRDAEMYRFAEIAYADSSVYPYVWSTMEASRDSVLVVHRIFLRFENGISDVHFWRTKRHR